MRRLLADRITDVNKPELPSNERILARAENLLIFPHLIARYCYIIKPIVKLLPFVHNTCQRLIPVESVNMITHIIRDQMRVNFHKSPNKEFSMETMFFLYFRQF